MTFHIIITLPFRENSDLCTWCQHTMPCTLCHTDLSPGLNCHRSTSTEHTIWVGLFSSTNLSADGRWGCCQHTISGSINVLIHQIFASWLRVPRSKVMTEMAKSPHLFNAAQFSELWQHSSYLFTYNLLIYSPLQNSNYFLSTAVSHCPMFLFWTDSVSLLLIPTQNGT